MSNIQNDIDNIIQVNSLDIEALEDARFTLEAIKEADPGTFDEIIDQSLRLITKALNISPMQSVENIAEKLGVQA